MEWYSKVYPSLTEDHAPMECVQEAGEILYLVNTGYRLYKLSTVKQLLFGWEKFCEISENLSVVKISPHEPVIIV